MTRRFFLAIAAVPLLLSFVRMPGPPALVWWTTHALEKVRPQDPRPESTQTTEIHAARNEFEPFQVVLRAEAGDIRDVDVDVTDLKGPGGAVIPKRHITVYLERYIDIETPSSVDGGTGEWPDALIPRVDRYKNEKRAAFPVTLSKDRNQPIWIEVYVPRTATSGAYEGQVQVSLNGRPHASIPYRLTVWDFELPSTSSLPTTFGFSGNGALRGHFGKYTNDEQLYELTFLYQKASLWHRVSLHYGSGIPPDIKLSGDNVQLDWSNFDKEIGPFMDGLVFGPNEPLSGAKSTSVAVMTPKSLKSAPHQSAYWRQTAEHFREKGWMDRMFHYLWDEPTAAHHPPLVRLGEVVHRADAQIPNLVTTSLRNEWSRFIGIWSPLINCVDRKPGNVPYCEKIVERPGYDAELAEGKRLWWYQSCASHGCDTVGGEYFRGWPSYMVDHHPVRNRIMEWITWKYGVGGELYFNTVEAYFKSDPWKDIRLHGGNGDGTLFYPGRPKVIGGTTDIPIESIRLKLIREGLEDYEYLTMLTHRAGRTAAAEFVNTIVRATYDFDQDPKNLYAVREAIGRELSNGVRN